MSERRDNKNRKLNPGEYQKSDGRYMYRYKSASGETRFLYSWTLTQTDRTPAGKQPGPCLRELERDALKDVSDNIDAGRAKRATLNQRIEEFLAQKQKIVRQSTFADYYSFWKKHICPDPIGRMELTKVRYSDVKKLYFHLRYDVGLRARSIGKVQLILSQVFDIAVRDGLIRMNPASHAMDEILAADRPEKRRALTIDEQTAFLGFVRNDPRAKGLLPFFIFLFGTGCRFGEAAGLTWNDCDFEHDIISINHGSTYIKPVGESKTRHFIIPCKTSAGNRVIPMLPEVREALMNIRRMQMSSGFSNLCIDGYSGFVFISKHGNLLLRSVVDYDILKIIERYNEQETAHAKKEHRSPLILPRFSAHNIRHTFCTRLCENISNIKVIQEVMGHANASVTMNIYSEATMDAKKQAFQSLDSKALAL